MSVSPRQWVLLVSLSIAVGAIYFLQRKPQLVPSDLEHFPVTGRITVAGTPLQRGTVNFVPDLASGTSHMNYPSGKIEPDGRYALETFGRPGAPAGTYRVVVISTLNEVPDDPRGWIPQWAVDLKYTESRTTDLTATVVASEVQQTYDFDLKK